MMEVIEMVEPAKKSNIGPKLGAVWATKRIQKRTAERTAIRRQQNSIKNIQLFNSLNSP